MSPLLLGIVPRCSELNVSLTEGGCLVGFCILQFGLILPAFQDPNDETPVNVCKTTPCYNPEDSHLHVRRRENKIITAKLIVKNVL
jgi:hypothetical protein